MSCCVAVQFVQKRVKLNYFKMNQFWIFFAVLSLLIHNSNGDCEINANDMSITLKNLRNSCDSRQLLSIFLNSTAGKFPPEGSLKGYVVECFDRRCGFINNFWDGKNIFYGGGNPPNDHGTASNNFLGRFVSFEATVYRANAPIDGKEAFLIDYKRDFFVYFAMDFVREVQPNLYVGFTTLRTFQTVPLLFFLLEKL